MTDQFLGRPRDGAENSQSLVYVADWLPSGPWDLASWQLFLPSYGVYQSSSLLQLHLVCYNLRICTTIINHDHAEDHHPDSGHAYTGRALNRTVPSTWTPQDMIAYFCSRWYHQCTNIHPSVAITH